MGGIYNVGILYSDDYGRTSFIVGQKTISVSDTELSLIAGVIIRQRIQWTLTGVPPAGFTKYCIACSKNQNHESYLQCQGLIHWYLRDLDATDAPGGTGAFENNTFGEFHYVWNGRVFNKFFVGSTVGNTAQPAFIQLPLNLPFVPDVTYFVKFKNTDFPQRIFKCEGMIGDFLVVTFPENVKTYISDNYASPLFEIEVFRQKDSVDSIYYEIGEWYNINAGSFTTLSSVLDGDTHEIYITDPGVDDEQIRDPRGHVYTSMAGLKSLGSFDLPVQQALQSGRRKWHAESPSGIFDSKLISESILTLFNAPGDDTPPISGFAGRLTALSTLDYTKSASSLGRPRTTNQDSREVDLYSIFGFSDPYVQNTFINGLNSFLAANKYPLAIERGRVRCAKRAGDVLVAIHERATSTLYIGEGFIRQGKDFILAKTESVVGDDRKLIGDYGTINPESVINIFDQLYWWDAYRGAVVRYTNAGLYPISNNGMESYFYEKSVTLFPYRNSVKITTSVDYLHGEFIISFPDVDTGDSVIIPGETWAFNLKEEVWRTRYSFIPERMASANNSLYGFKDGALWEHNKSDVYNNFYGVQYDRRWRPICNPHPSRNKRYLNVHHQGLLVEQVETDIPFRYYTKEGQESYTPAILFEQENGSVGKWTGPVMKDINTPVEPNQNSLNSGDDLVSSYLELEIINNRSDESPCSEVNVVYTEDLFSI
jgi:hypothetical protein